MTTTKDRIAGVREPGQFDDEIDLRRVLQVLLRHWPWIVLTTVVAALVAAGYSFLILSPSYRATALVAITPPKYVMQLSPGFEAVAQERIQTEIYGTYPELALSDELLQQVVEAIHQDSGYELLPLARLRNKVSVEGSKDVGLIYLRVTDSRPKLAASIVNTWAEYYVSMLNRLYGGEAGDYEFFVGQLALAKEDLSATQDALVEFKARDRSSVLERQLEAADAALVDRLARRDQIVLLLSDIEGWQQQLASFDQGYQPSSADELTFALLQLKAFDMLGEEPQLQVVLGQAVNSHDVASQFANLDSLTKWLQTRSAELSAQISELEPEILLLQEELQEVANEGERLSQEVEIATSLYQSLTLKAEESRIDRESQAGVSRLASRAEVPTRPLGSRRLSNTAFGAGLGLLVGIALAVVMEISGQRGQPTEPESSGDGY